MSLRTDNKRIEKYCKRFKILWQLLVSNSNYNYKNNNILNKNSGNSNNQNNKKSASNLNH